MSAVDNRSNLAVNGMQNAEPEIITDLKELAKKVSWVVWAVIAAVAVVLGVVVSAWLGAGVVVLGSLIALAIANCKPKPESIREAARVDDLDALDAIAIRHDPVAWKREYDAANVEGQRRMNAELGRQTLNAIDNGFVVDGRVIYLEQDPELEARVLQNMYEADQLPGDVPQQIFVENLTTLQMTERLIQEGFNPLVCNWANKRDVGGDFLGGARAQEETLCRESDLYRRLEAVEDQYPIPEHGGILVPQVQFFRKDLANGYAFMEPIKADVFAVAFYNCNRAHGDGYDKPATQEEYLEGTRQKIRAILRTAMENGNDSVVLGAGGCGAFRNDPRVISDLFREELNRFEFLNRFERVAFAIIDDHNVPPGRLSNFQTFRRRILG